ncbi:uncharacterized protein LOC135715500 [Ochlerotatus camptorhynchus]|uniref:uncharacterized protein LOC135715032 n=1 Tax=Ochlerotatus camptorhynchus TaxID=644619 RepID=UPI0031D08869
MPQHKNQLSAVIKGRGQAGFSEYEVLKVFCDVCESLAQLHCSQAPVIYRDLKVENVVQNDMGRFILSESSTATTRFLNPVAHGKKAVEEEIQKNTTQAYRAPEMIDLNSGHSITTKGDIWALGCLLYRLCFGTLPFGESSKAILHCQYNIPEKCRYSPELCQLIRFLLEADPEKRPSIYQVCEFAFKISGKDNPLRIARERQKSQSLGNNHHNNYSNSDHNERKHHQIVGLAASAPFSVSTSVAPRSRPKGQHSGTGGGFNLGPPPLNPSPKNVVSPVPGAEADVRQLTGQEKASAALFVANFSDNFPTACAQQSARSPAGLNMDLQHQSVAVGETQRNIAEVGFRCFPSDAKHLLIPPVESSVPKDKPSAVSPASLLSPFEPEPPSSSSSSTRPRPTTLLPAGHHHSKSSTSSSQHRRHHHVLSNSNSEKSLVSPVSNSTWNPFGDASPFSPSSTLIEDHLFGAEFDKLRLEGGSQTSIVTSPEEMKSERSWLRKPQRQQRFSLPTLTQACSTSVLPSSTVEIVPEEDPFGSAPFTLPKRLKDKTGRSSKLTSKLSEVIAGAAGGGGLWRHSTGGGGGKESLISTTPGAVSGENGRNDNADEGVDKSALLGIKLDDLISGGEKGSPNFIKLPLDDRNKYEKLNSNDVTSDDSDSEFYPDSAGGVKKHSFKQFVENNIPEKLQAVYHKVDKGQIKNVQIVKKLRGKVETKKGQPKVGRSKDKQHAKKSVGEQGGKEGESDDSIGSASDLRANDDFPDGDEGESGKTVPGKPSKKLNRMTFGDGSVDDCISESIKTCGSSAYHAECESVTTNEDNSSRIVTRVRVKKREHDSKHSVIDEDDSGEEDMIQGDKPLLLDDELDYESAPENNTSGEEVLMDPFTPESLPDESEKLTEEDEIDLDPFAMAPFKKPAVPKRTSIKYMPNVNPIPENCPTIPAPSLPPPPPSVDNFCTSTPIKPARSQLEPIDLPPPPPPVTVPITAPEPVPFRERSPNARTDLFGLEPFPPLVLSPPIPATRPVSEATSIPTVTVQSGSVALTHIIPNTMAALPIVIPLEPAPPPILQKPNPNPPMIARSSYINFGQIPTQSVINSFSPDNNYVNFQTDYDDDDDVRKLKSDDYDDSSDTVVKSSSKGGGFLSKKEKVKYNSLKDHKTPTGKDDSSIMMLSGSGSAGNHTSIIPVKLSQKVKVNVGGYKKVSAKVSKKEKSNGSAGGERYEENSTKSAKACKQMGFSNMSFEDFPSDDAIEEHRAGPTAQRHGPFEVVRNDRTLLEAEKKFGSLKRRSNPFS